MITKKQFVIGLSNYIDDEIIPKLPTSGKWAMSTFSIIVLKRSEGLIESLGNVEMIKQLKLIENENVDTDILCDALSESAKKYGDLSITIPMVGLLTFNYDDICKLKQYF